MFSTTRAGCVVILLLAAACAQEQATPPVRPRVSEREASPAAVSSTPKARASRKFVIDVVNSAVALPQPDQQDRLRVLSAAVEVLSPVDSKAATELSKEGIRIESELIAIGQKPAASLFAAGQVDCKTAVDFVQKIYPQNVAVAEQSMIGAFQKCPKQTLDLVRSRAEAALQQNAPAPRLLMSLIEMQPPNSGWSQRVFTQLFSSLPSELKPGEPVASDFATMFASAALKMDKDTVRDAGIKFFIWLGKQDDSGDKNLAVNITAEAMKQSLGEEAYKRALERDVIAQQVANLEGAEGQRATPDEETVSVSDAMASAGSDQRESLKSMAPSLRARQAAALGFAKGTSGDRSGADQYFDIAFSAADDAWSDRGDKDLAPLIQEVSEAAAQVDAIDALRRAQALQDPSAKAIGMIAVARVVLSKSLQV